MTRDENGRFVKGHPKMGGRPTRAKEDAYYRILMTACSQKDWEAIVDKAVEQAKRGDAVARKWLADYLVGPPIERKEITGADGGAIHVKLKGLDD
jgi:hypothetical protein